MPARLLPRGSPGAAPPLLTTPRPPTAPRLPTALAVAGLELLSIAFTPPQALAAGVYELQVAVRLPRTPGTALADGAELRSSSLSVLITGAAAGEGAGLWPQVMRAAAVSGREAVIRAPTEAPAGAPHGNPSGEGGRDPAARTRLEGFAAAYRAILGDLAAGRETAARAALGELEAALLRDGSLDLSRLAVQEIRTVRSVAAQAPEALVPVLHLYALLYAESRSEARYQLSTHAREMIFGLADFYARQSGTPAGRRLAARLLISFGGGLAAVAGPNGFTAKACRRAAAWDPDGEAAPLCLAIDAEWRGEYRQALAELRRLLARHPESIEGRLRLAVNLARLGQEAEAEAELRTVARDGGAGWPAAVACQELGRLRIRGGRLAEAEQALREGLQRLPDDEAMVFELAFVLERRGRPAEAAAVLAPLRPAARGEEGSRHLYTRLPAALRGGVDGEIQAAIAERLPALGAALAATAQEAGSR